MSDGEGYDYLKDDQGTFEWVFGLLRQKVELLEKRAKNLERENDGLDARLYEAEAISELPTLPGKERR